MMKIEHQVCSYEQALKLKQLGMKQVGHFTWMEALLSNDGESFTKWWALFRPNTGAYDFVTDTPFPPEFDEYDEEYETAREASAFTVAELGVMLPTGYDTMQNTIDGWRGYDDSGCDMPPYDTIRMKHVEGYNTEAECRGAMLIYLLESNLITAQEVNERL